jgi:hypothetical protein
MTLKFVMTGPNMGSVFSDDGRRLGALVLHSYDATQTTFELILENDLVIPRARMDPQPEATVTMQTAFNHDVDIVLLGDPAAEGTMHITFTDEEIVSGPLRASGAGPPPAAEETWRDRAIKSPLL